MITIRSIAKFVGAVAVMALMVWLAAWSLAYCLDDEEQQVRERKKDPRTAILPVLPKR